MNIALLAAGIVFVVVGCKKSTTTEQPSAQASVAPVVPNLLSETDAGFVDLSFLLERASTAPDGTQTLRVKGRREGRDLSFEITLSPGWQPSRLGTVTLRSVGPASDAFVGELDRIYGTNLSPAAMAPSTPFSALPLEGEPARLDYGRLRLKLFYENDQSEVAELYLNIDRAHERVELNEKDTEHRKQLVRALSANKP